MHIKRVLFELAKRKETVIPIIVHYSYSFFFFCNPLLLSYKIEKFDIISLLAFKLVLDVPNMI